MYGIAMASNGSLSVTSFAKIRRKVQKLKFTYKRARLHTHTHTHTHWLLYSRRPTAVVLAIECMLKMFANKQSQPQAYHNRLLSHDLVNTSTAPIVKLLNNFVISGCHLCGPLEEAERNRQENRIRYKLFTLHTLAVTLHCKDMHTEAR